MLDMPSVTAHHPPPLTSRPLPGMIRDCRPDDFAVVADIYNTFVVTGGVTMDTVLKSAEDVAAQVAGFNAREALIILEDEGLVRGWGIIKRYSERLGYRASCETSVYLRPEDVRRGYGSRIKRAVIDRCRTLGYHCLVARVMADNAACIAYNCKLGYRVVGTFRELGYRHGRWVDVVLMQLLLEDVPPYLPELG